MMVDAMMAETMAESMIVVGADATAVTVAAEAMTAVMTA